MNAILMSIKPKWVEKIASGEEKFEFLKSVPKCGTPFKVYMYCTNDRKVTLNMANGRGVGRKGELFLNGNCYYPHTDGTLNGKVVGEFVCDKGLHISDLKIYDTPKELSEFRKPCDAFIDCLTCKRGKLSDLSCKGQITRPPMSWCYVEEVEK